MKAQVSAVSRALSSVPSRLGVGRRHAYHPFFVLASARTGSNMVIGLLRSSRNIVAYGEILSRSPNVAWGNRTMAPLRRRHWADLRDSDPARFVTGGVYREYPSYVRAVGFKAFYHHLDSRPQVLEALRGIEDLTVLHLRRRNVLAMATSSAIAHATDQWVRTRRSPSMGERIEPIRVDIDDLVARIRKYVANEDWAERNLPGARVFALDYELLQAEHGAALVEPLRHSGLSAAGALSTPTVRQRRSDWRDSIANAAEVEHRLTGTEWEYLLHLPR